MSEDFVNPHPFSCEIKLELTEEYPLNSGTITAANMLDVISLDETTIPITINLESTTNKIYAENERKIFIRAWLEFLVDPADPDSISTTDQVSLAFKLFIFPDCSEDSDALLDSNVSEISSASISQIPGGQLELQVPTIDWNPAFSENNIVCPVS